jgi:hypothetical protein
VTILFPPKKRFGQNFILHFWGRVTTLC